MSTITALRTGKRTGKRINLFLDGKFAFSMDRDRVAREKLEVGLELSADRLDMLMASRYLDRCLDAAYRLLGYRLRSETELRERLQRRGFSKEIIGQTLIKLREQGLLDDVVFARFWVENRATFRPRSREMTRHELLKKGVAEDAIDRVTGEIDEAESAYRAASDKARRLLHLAYEDYRQRLWEFLRRRGFTYDIINRTVRRVWEEQQKES